MSSDLNILHALRVKGLARPDVLGALTGLSPDSLAAACAPLIDRGLVISRSGRVAGYMATPEGKSEAIRMLAADDATQAARPQLAQFDEQFLPVNSEFKQICHSWQVKDDGEPNNHTEAAYDGSVIQELERLHARVVPMVDDLGAALPRFARYTGRLDDALQRIRSGDSSAFARPMYDSYHDIWMELHNDVVLSLDRERGHDDEH